MPLASLPEWRFVGHASGTRRFLLDGLNVFEHDWRNVLGEPPAEVRDPLYNQSFSFPVYEIISGTKRVVFAAGEFSNNEWGFYQRD